MMKTFETKTWTGWQARATYSARLAVFGVSFFCPHFARAQSAEPIQTVVPVSISAAPASIAVGRIVYPSSANPGVQMLALKRQPDSGNLGAPDLISNQTFTDPSSANQFLTTLLESTPDALLIVNAVRNYGFALNAIAKSLEMFGVAKNIEGVGISLPFVLVGTGGLNIATAHQRFSSTLNMNGYLAVDSNNNYTFIQTDYVKFDIGLDGTIKIGPATYTVATSAKIRGCNGANAFHVLALQRELPTHVLLNNTYCTGQSNNEISRIIGDVSNLASSEMNLVFIGSSGHPIPADWNFGTDGDGRIYPLAHLVAQLGGYWETMAYLTPTDTYSLVGALAPPAGIPGARQRGRESSSVYPGRTSTTHPSGELHGVLARGLRGNWYSPLSIDPTGKANLGFYQILAQQPVPFPHPANAAELAAFQYISNQLCGGCNVRNQYPDTNISISNYQNSLSRLQDPQGGTCNSSNADTTFCIVRQQLLTEFAYVADIRNFNQNLQTLWLASGTDSILSLLSTYSSLQETLKAPVGVPAPSLMGSIVNFFLGLAGFIPDVGPLFGIADTAFNFGMSLTTDPKGNPAPSLTSTVGGLEQQAENLFNAQATTTGTQFDFIYQDWGKISSLGADLAQAQPGSPWFWDSSATGRILQAMSPAVEESYYQSLMAAVYAVGSYVPAGWNANTPDWGETPIWLQPGSYGTNSDNGEGEFVATPFTFGLYYPYTFPTDSTYPLLKELEPLTDTLLAENSWLAISLQTTLPSGGSVGQYDPPDSSVLAHLFLSPSEGGLGVYQAAFFEGWPFPRVTCDVSNIHGDPGYGCDWGAAAPPPEALPGPLTRASIKIRPSRKKSLQGHADFTLLISNSGTVEARSIVVDRIALRTLAGSGQAALEEPTLPIRTVSVMPGTFTTITLHLTAPLTIKKLSLTEEGSVDNGEIEPSKFSLGQIVFP